MTISPRYLGQESLLGFWGGFAGGAMLYTGNAIWNFATHHKSRLLAPLATTAFTQQLAVGASVYAATQHIFTQLRPTCRSSLQHHTIAVLSMGASVALGALSAALITQATFPLIFYPMCAVSAYNLWSHFSK